MGIETIAALVRQGFVLQDPDMAAERLPCLILSIPLDRAMLLGGEHGLTEAALDR